GDAHDVVVWKHPIAAKERERQDSPTAALFHQRQTRARDADQRVRADVERDAEPFARCLHERVRQLRSLCECGTVHDEVQTTELLFKSAGERGDLIVVRDIARNDEWLYELLSQLADVVLESFARISQRKPSTLCVERLSNSPRN